MKSLIVANWKMNPDSLEEAKNLFNLIKRGLTKTKNKKLEVVICPPFVYLPLFLGSSTFAQTRLRYGGSSVAFGVGGQDCFWEEKGAFTGEISPVMLKNLGCQYVILGHSERRRHFLENDEMINKKIKATIFSKLNPILCIGETQVERDKGLTKKILNFQIRKGLKGIAKKEIKKIIIAYEPVWAIGTGKSCSLKDARVAGDFIRRTISLIHSRKIAKGLRILYGGSVNSENAANYIFAANFQGLLVGGASLNAKEFIKILNNVT